METNNGNENKTFSYTYSAKQQEEVRRIQKKYLPPAEDKLEQLRKLDREAERKATMVSIIVGAISALVLGTGMSLTMVWTNYFVSGIIVGIIGIAGVASALPVYKRVVKKQREKLAPQVLALTEELMNQK